ncbi:hypothetical protein TRIUR3_23304 [Triticum urartu]|uniref:Glycoside hydrolase family 5 domain-containing protein n=1 Tax=Triticum urartu TaxID=4572 RepID=M7YIW9_TRIUA|nr:hypothetical protein TRIUR3_23304 [Triticum urartu]
MGFNCVRLTWPTFLVTNASYSSLTVEQSFQRLNLTESLAGIRANNPTVVDLKLIDAFKASSLGENNVMVILDNHVSKPGWCCDNADGNGFFGDGYFEPDVWVDGLTKMATMFAGVPHVVGMSLRNELRGPRQNSNDWYKYMQRGAEAVHAANPRVLVILSGLSFDNDLAFLNSRQVSLSFARKAAFEVHWYSFSNGQEWAAGNPNELHVAVNASSSSSSGSGDGRGMLCLDVGADGQSVVTNPCRCLSADNSCDPESQWFKMVSSTRSVAANSMLAELPVKLGSSKIRSL